MKFARPAYFSTYGLSAQNRSDLGQYGAPVGARREPTVDLASRGQSSTWMYRLDLAPKESYQASRCNHRVTKPPVVSNGGTYRELQPVIWIDKDFFPRSVHGNYWSSRREDQNAVLIWSIGRAVWKLQLDYESENPSSPVRRVTSVPGELRTALAGEPRIF